MPQTDDSATPPTATDGAALLRHVLQSTPAQAGRLSAALSRPRHAGILRTIRREGLISDDAIARLRADQDGLPLIDPRVMRADPALACRLGLGLCQREGLLPWQSGPQGTIILAHDPAAFSRNHARLDAAFGPVIPAIAPYAALAEALLQDHGPAIAAEAETRVTPEESCRTLDTGRMARVLAALLLGFAVALVSFPAVTGAVLLVVALATLTANTALKLAALMAAPLRPHPPPQVQHPDLLPAMSILVALYREADIAPRLVQRLQRLDYPRDRIEVLLVVEDTDDTTRDALARADLPDWFRVVVAPAGTVRTKPRALNVALPQCRGTIVGVYDAEDAPDPRQLRDVAARFAVAAPDVACLQGVLDFYNPRANAIARLFTLEYRAWFRVLLPGIARLGLAVPLGGTTLFFRRAVLEELGAWDGHNVTEDADLGLRLFRRGWRTELLDSVTLEEANCRPVAWVKQRSRWSKGYMMTWAVHMRDPRRLWRQIGAFRFIGLQVQLAGSVLGALLAPVLCLWWVLLPTAWLPYAPRLAMLMFIAGAVDALTTLIAHRKAGGGFSALWLLLMPAYHLLATAAALKALWELARRPFYWDKTAHGQFGG